MPVNPNASGFNIVQNAGKSDYGALQLQFQRSLSKGLTVLGSYTWSHCRDDGSANFEVGYLRGNCDFDVRHSFSAAVSYNLPNVGGNGFIKAILDHWGVDDRFTARTAFPVFLTTQSVIFSPVTGLPEPAYYYSVPGQPLYLSGSACVTFFGPNNSYRPSGSRSEPALSRRTRHQIRVRLLCLSLPPAIPTQPVYPTPDVPCLAK